MHWHRLEASTEVSGIPLFWLKSLKWTHHFPDKKTTFLFSLAHFIITAYFLFHVFLPEHRSCHSLDSYIE